MEDIAVGVDKLDSRLDHISSELDKNDEIVQEIRKDVRKLASDVESVNQSLKKSLNKVRAPNKLCVDITLTFVLAALIGTLTWVIQYYNSLE